jgi:hypothetical protein
MTKGNGETVPNDAAAQPAKTDPDTMRRQDADERAAIARRDATEQARADQTGGE